MEDIAGSNIGEFTVSKRLGSSEVFLATSTVTGIDYFMCRWPAGAKCILSERELNQLKRFDHKNILCLWDTFEFKSHIYAFYKYSGEEVLASYVQSKGGLLEPEIRAVVQQMVAGCSALAEAGLAHGNLTPDSILLIPTSPPVVKLFNFRITKSSYNSYVTSEVSDGRMKCDKNTEVWSIGRIVMFLDSKKAPTENLEEKKNNEYLTRSDMSSKRVDFFWRCVRCDAEERIKYDEMVAHPYLLEEAVEVERASGKAVLIQSPLQEDRKHRLQNADVRRIKFAADEAYVCGCENGKEVTLSCGHSFCVGCTAKMREKSSFTDSFIRGSHEDSYSISRYDKIEIKCPKCLALFKIEQIILRCGCEFVKGDKRKVIKKVGKFATDYSYACREHGRVLSSVEQWAIRGEVYHELSKGGIKSNEFSNKALRNVAEMLRKDHAVTSLFVNGEGAKHESIRMLALALKDNCKLTTLHLSEIKLDPKATKLLMAGIMKSNSLRNLTFDRSLNAELMPLFTAIRRNKTIAHLKIIGCTVFYRDAKALALTIRENDTLAGLFLQCLSISKKGLDQIMLAVKDSHTLHKFALTCILRERNGEALALMIKNNKTLEELTIPEALDIGDHEVSTKTAKALADAIRENQVLTKLEFLHDRSNGEKDQLIGQAVRSHNTLTSYECVYRYTGDVPSPVATVLNGNERLTEFRVSGGDIFDEVELKEGNVLRKLAIRAFFRCNCLEIATKIMKANKGLTCLKIVDIRKNEAIKSFMSEVKKSETLLKLTLKSCNIAGEGAEAIAEMLKVNTRLSTLKLKMNRIGKESVGAITRALKFNTTLTKLDLSDNPLENKGAKRLSVLLKANTSLKELNLSRTSITPKGAHALSEALKSNTSLIELNLSGNELGRKGAKAFGEMLESNTALLYLDLSNYELDNETVELIIAGIKSNNTLKVLKLERFYADEKPALLRKLAKQKRKLELFY